MNYIKHLVIFSLFCICGSKYAIGQSDLVDDSSKPLIITKMLNQLDDKAAFVNSNLDKQTSRYLTRMCRQEQRLKRQLMKLDSSAAKKLFNGAEEKYEALESKMKNISSIDPGSFKGEYLPYLDSIKGAFKFLDKNKDLLAAGSGIGNKLKEINQVQNSLHQAKDVTAFLTERTKQIGKALKKYTELPKGISKNYSALSKMLTITERRCKSIRIF